MHRIVELPVTEWSAELDPETSRGVVTDLELGKVLYLPRLEFPLSAAEERFLDPRWLPQGERLGNVRVGVRPEDVEILGPDREGAMSGTVTAHQNLPLKNGSYLSIRVGEDEVHAQTEGRERHVTGDRISFRFKRYHVFDKTSGARLNSHPERSHEA